MILDSKGKLFGKVSIIDILIVLVIVGGIGGLVYKMNKSHVATVFTKADKVQITFYTEKISENAVKAVKVGDKVKDKLANTVLGTVTNKEIGDSIDFNANSEGKTVKSTRPGYVSVKVTTEVKGVLSDMGITIGTNDYYVNKYFEARFGISDFWIYITDIKKLEG